MERGRRGTTVEVDGFPVFYETEGSGRPVVLLHGGMASNATWNGQFAGLGAHRQVIAPERQGHGHTPDRPGALSFAAMAAETASLLGILGLGPVDLVGWSDGGMVGLRLAIERPELVRSLTTFGAGFSSAGNVAGTVESLTALEADDQEVAPMAQMYGDVSPDGAGHFPVVWDKVRRLWAEPFDWSEDLARVVAPVLVMVADDDLFTVSHAEAFARGVPNGQLAVIPGTSHLAPIEKPALFNQLVLDFTDDPSVGSMMPQWRSPG